MPSAGGDEADAEPAERGIGDGLAHPVPLGTERLTTKAQATMPMTPPTTEEMRAGRRPLDAAVPGEVSGTVTRPPTPPTALKGPPPAAPSSSRRRYCVAGACRGWGMQRSSSSATTMRSRLS